MAMLICTARSLRSTAESMATPSCVNTNGGWRSPILADGLDILARLIHPDLFPGELPAGAYTKL